MAVDQQHRPSRISLDVSLEGDGKELQPAHGAGKTSEQATTVRQKKQHVVGGGSRS